MSFLQFIRADVGSVISGVSGQKQIVSGLLDQINAAVPRVQSAWIGGDADEFASDVSRKLIPAMNNLIAAIAGTNVNIAKATDVVDQADRKVKGLADQLAGIFKKI